MTKADVEDTIIIELVRLGLPRTHANAQKVILNLIGHLTTNPRANLTAGLVRMYTEISFPTNKPQENEEEECPQESPLPKP
jgi:hypothetical protein